MRLRVLTPREASIFACVCDTVAAPEPVLAPVRDTEAVSFFDDWLARSPRLNRLALRGLLYAAELSPRAVGQGRRLRRLDEAARADTLARIEAAKRPEVRQLAKLVKGMALLSYYCDRDVMRRLGFDAAEVVRRGRELRAREGRP